MGKNIESKKKKIKIRMGIQKIWTRGLHLKETYKYRNMGWLGIGRGTYVWAEVELKQ